VIRKIEELTKVENFELFLSFTFVNLNKQLKKSIFFSFLFLKIQTQCGNVEAKVICAFRGQEIPPAIMATVEKYQANSKAEAAAAAAAAADGTATDKPSVANAESTTANKDKSGNGDFSEAEVSDLNGQQRYNLKHREVYFSKYTDTIAATTIRSKCSVLLFNEEIERYSDYLNKDVSSITKLL
jgi:hypothetical protein